MAYKWYVGCTKLLKHTIVTKGDPILMKPRRQPANLENKIEELIKNLEDNNKIKRCNSSWNTPMVCLWKGQIEN